MKTFCAINFLFDFRRLKIIFISILIEKKISNFSHEFKMNFGIKFLKFNNNAQQKLNFQCKVPGNFILDCSLLHCKYNRNLSM